MYRVTPDFETGIIRAMAYGTTLHAAECQRLIDEVDEAVQLTGIHCVLLEVGADHAVDEPFPDKLRLANRLVNDPTITHTRFAYVPIRDADIDPVVETLAQAKGFQGQRFGDRDTALEWLTASSDACLPGAAARGPDDARPG
ncbi:MAG TPA: hypothetical protein VLM17_10565 [Xanthomonadaceae bacterium]|nr:hypothetical protein [Xanthomonadaceae bacterium]